MVMFARATAVPDLKMLAKPSSRFRQPFQIVVKAAKFDGGKHLLRASRVSAKRFEQFRFHEHADRLRVKTQKHGCLFDCEPCRQS